MANRSANLHLMKQEFKCGAKYTYSTRAEKVKIGLFLNSSLPSPIRMDPDLFFCISLVYKQIPWN